jgi:RNA polymerase sigma-32 factor
MFSHGGQDRAGERAGAAALPSDVLKRYLSEISRHAVLSREKELEIAERAHRYKDRGSLHRLVISNLRLVVKIALEYRNPRLTLLDLIQEGNVGLIHAVKKYNPYKGTRFSTYASFWIRAYMLKHIIDSWSIVKVGTTGSQRRLFFRLKREKEKLEALGVYPATQLLASTLGVKAEEVEEMEKRLSCTDVSFERPAYEGDEETFMGTIGVDDNIEESLAAREKQEILEEKIKEFKKVLNAKELFIFEHRTAREEPLTLQEIGERFSISRERVRQLEHKMLKRLSEKLEPELRKLELR